MSAPRVTVLIPTQAHAAYLPFSLRSVARQTVQDYELFVVGDGTDDATRALVKEQAALDPRIRFFDRPKGERHGEAHRHDALQEASGEIVCYLGDDDLWLPDQLECMQALLAEKDFGHTLHAFVLPSDELRFVPGDLSDARLVRILCERVPPLNRVGLSCAGHRRAAYDALPVGWAPAPPEVFTDLHMWRKFFAQKGIRLGTLPRPTALHFPSPMRAGCSEEQRVSELRLWEQRIADGSIATELARAAWSELLRLGNRWTVVEYPVS